MFKSKTTLALQILSILHTTTTAGERISVEQIALKTEKSESFIEQIVAVLRDNQLVQGHRGPGGGYVCTVAALRCRYPFEYQRTRLAAFADLFYPDDEYRPHISAQLKLTSVGECVLPA